MNVGSLGNWLNSQDGSTNSKVENYGTSWLRDLLAAQAYAPTPLSGGRTFLFNGAVDANMGYTPAGHSTHDLGMAFDLGLKQYISGANQNSTATEPPLQISDTSNAWDLTHAIDWSGLLPSDLLPPSLQGDFFSRTLNNQRDALRDFLSLYAVTQDDGVSGNGVGWDDFPVRNGTPALAALFGKGTQTGGLLSQVLIGGGSGTNPYVNMNSVLDHLGINAQAGGPHNTHFHIYLRLPGRNGNC